MAMTATLVLVATLPAGGATDFYYDHWQCNNYLAGETINVRSPTGRLLELHVRNNVRVRLRVVARRMQCAPADIGIILLVHQCCS